MKLTEIAAPDFDLALTLDSGQVFHWENVDNGFVGTIGDEPVYAEQSGELLRVSSGCTELVRRYFALDHPLAEICASFPSDTTMNAAQHFCRGLRIIRQPKWECLATFIASTRKKVAHIRQISLALRNRFGDLRKIDKHVIYTFPSPRRLAQSSEQKLQECALGYRAKSLLATARLVSSGEANLGAWSALSDVDLRARLGWLPGVGAKVANCVMLFAYGRLRCFPIDVWIERVLREKYFPRTKKITARGLREFSETFFGEHGGYAQQYLFHHTRMASRKSAASRDSSTALHSPRNDKRDTPMASRKRDQTTKGLT